MSRVTENSVSTTVLSFIVYFLKYMKDEVKIYDKLDKKKFIKKFTISTISTISTKTYYFNESTTILHYFTLPTT